MIITIPAFKCPTDSESLLYEIIHEFNQHTASGVLAISNVLEIHIFFLSSGNVVF